MFLSDVESEEDEDLPSTEESGTAISTEDPAGGQKEQSEDEVLLIVRERASLKNSMTSLKD